jgi:hypothetical protein
MEAVQLELEQSPLPAANRCHSAAKAPEMLARHRKQF